MAIANVNYSSSELGINCQLREPLHVSTSVILYIYSLFFNLLGQTKYEEVGGLNPLSGFLMPV